jgi:hypothetical protein
LTFATQKARSLKRGAYATVLSNFADQQGSKNRGRFILPLEEDPSLNYASLDFSLPMRGFTVHMFFANEQRQNICENPHIKFGIIDIFFTRHYSN